MDGSAGELEALDRGIAALEQQREALGDAVVDTALRPLLERRRRLAGQPGERRKLVTVLFSDLADSTPLTTALGDEVMREVMARYFRLWRDAVEAQGGHVQKFIGDAVVGVFGMERAREDDPHRAVRAAVSVRPALARLAEEVRARHGQALATRVGIDTGEVVLGRFDERGDGDLVVVGATVNRAARLQTAAPPDGILLSAATARHVRGSFGLQEHGELELKGVEGPVRTFVVHSAAGSGFWSTARGLEGVSTRTVGRDVELRQLTRLFEDTVVERSSTVVTVVGHAGIGKSRLLADLESWVAGLPDGAWVLRGRADPADEGVPHAMLRSAFAERFSIQDNDPPEQVLSKWREGMAVMAGDLGGGGDDLMTWLGFTAGADGPLPAPGDPGAVRRRAWASLDATLAAMCVRGPVVLLLEDLHWADRSVLDLLQDLQARPRPFPLVVVATTRPVLFDQHPHWGEGLPGHREVRLQPLSRRETADLVREVLQRVEDLPAWVGSLVADAAEGNPFFVEEVIAWLVDNGTISTGPDGWSVSPEPLTTGAVPSTLRALLEARLDSLPATERTLVDRASVIGRVFWDAAVEHLDPDAPTPGADAYEGLRRREVVHQRPASSFAQAREFAFRHALLRDVAYDGLLSPARRRYHARAADWVLDRARTSGRLDEHAGTIAHHLLEADLADSAAPWLLRAGCHAAATFANDEALDLLARAAGATRDDDLRFAVLLEQQLVLDRTGRREEQRDVLDRLETAAGDDPGRRARVLVERGRWLFFHAEYPDAVEVAGQAAELARRAGRPEEEVEARIMVGRALAFAGEHAAARERLESALVMAREHGTHRQVAEGLRLLGVVATNLHEEQEAVRLLEESAARYQHAGDDEGMGMVNGQLSAVLMLSGRMEEAKVYSERALAVFTASGHLLRQGIVLGNLSSIALDTGRVDEGLVAARRSLELTESVEDIEGVVSSLQRIGAAARHLGMTEEARDACSRTVELGQEHGLHYFVAHALTCWSALALDEQAPEEALALARRARDAAALSEVPIALAQASWALGLARLTLGDGQAAVDALEETRSRTHGLGLRVEVVETWAAQAEALLVAGRVEEARSVARRVAVALGPDGPPPSGELHPGRGLLACHRVLDALGDPWAGDVAGAAGRFLERRAALVSDPVARAGFLGTADCRALAGVAAAVVSAPVR
ncbi:ATP-binding protein [Ornithinimicrobium pekingense]|uniref:ATP-binding protein n=1 Tax=Ornithinimicrobium pekingense TaxID=384677 RepID=UPI00146AD068|nr:AAA family ATPase [Ornithinimicrobium pekingense]